MVVISILPSASLIRSQCEGFLSPAFVVNGMNRCRDDFDVRTKQRITKLNMKHTQHLL